MTRKTFKMTLLAFALATNLFFSPCHFLKAVYAEGVTIDFQSLINLLSVELPPNTAIPPIYPTSPESSGPALPSAFVDKNSNTNPNPLNLLNLPEPTDELFRPQNFGPLIGDELLLPGAEYYTVTVCLIYNEVAASGCSETNTHEQAAEKLASFILNKSLRGVMDRPFRMILPSSMPEENQVQMLREIETRAICIIESAILEELERLGKHLPGKKEEGIRQKQTLTQKMNIARQSADNGTNWTHNRKKERSLHYFNVQKSYGQLNTILVSQ